MGTPRGTGIVYSFDLFRDDPSLELAFKLAIYFDCTIEDIFPMIGLSCSKQRSEQPIQTVEDCSSRSA